MIKERKQQAIVCYILLEKRICKVYILYKGKHSSECICITKYFLLIFLCKCNTFQIIHHSVTEWWEKRRECNQTRKLPASNSFIVSMLITVKCFSIDKIALICWNLYFQQLFIQHLKHVLVMEWWKDDNKYKCSGTLNSCNESNDIIRLSDYFRLFTNRNDIKVFSKIWKFKFQIYIHMVFYFEKLFHIKLWTYKTITFLWKFSIIIKTVFRLSFKKLIFHYKNLAFSRSCAVWTTKLVWT